MKKIMLIEDDPTMVDLLSMLFQLEGYQAALIDWELGLIESIRSHEPDLLLMDCHLDKMICDGSSGIDYLETIRSDQDLQDLKVIMISGMDLHMKSDNAGADDFLFKPFTPDELMGKIRELLE
jgi:DNA-binding response OmpR family regulator